MPTNARSNSISRFAKATWFAVRAFGVAVASSTQKGALCQMLYTVKLGANMQGVYIILRSVVDSVETPRKA